MMQNILPLTYYETVFFHFDTTKSVQNVLPASQEEEIDQDQE